MTLQPDETPYENGQHQGSGSMVVDFKSAADRELEDLVYSWKRVTDPKLRKIALDLIRSMAA